MTETAPTTDLHVIARLRVAIARTNRQLRQEAGSGLPLSMHAALVSIEQCSPLSLGELAAIEQVVPATITKIVRRLVDEGLVQRTIDPTDRRVAFVALTPAGATRLAETRSRRTAWLADRIRDEPAVTAEDLAITTRTLERLSQTAGPRPTPPDGTGSTP